MFCVFLVDPVQVPAASAESFSANDLKALARVPIGRAGLVADRGETTSAPRMD